MRITIGSRTATFVVCAGAAESQFPENVRIDHERQVQIAQYLRSETARPYYRGNRQIRIAFQVTREHEDHRAACDFIAEHDAELPSSGTPHFIHESESGDTDYELTNGLLVQHSADAIGAASIHQYEFLGSQWTKVV